MTETDDNFLKFRYAAKHRDRYDQVGGEYRLKENGLTQILNEGNATRLAEELRNRDPNSLDKFAQANMRGYAKLFAGAYSLPLSGLEMLGAIDEGSVNEFGQSFEAFLETTLPEQDGIMPMLVEGFSQYLVPGIGYYRLFGAMTRMKGFDKFLGAALKGEKSQKFAKVGTRLFGSEFFTVMTAQNPTDPNFTGFMVDVFGLDEETSVLLQNEMIASIASPAEDWEAASVFKEKLEAVPGDIALAAKIELALPILKSIVLTFRGIKRNKDKIVDIVDEEGILPEQVINNNAAKFSEDVYEPLTLTQREEVLPGILKAIEDGKKTGGFSVTIDGKTPAELGYEGGFMIAPLKETEIRFPVEEIDAEEAIKFVENVDRLRVVAGGRYKEIYAGGWIDDGEYVLDASVRVDNKEDALYIARAGNQDAIFDLTEFKDIGTAEGITQLKRDKVYSPTRQLEQIRNRQDVSKGFRKARMESNRQEKLAGGTI
jgi:hypothetical protein